jgi:ERCC4-type nuclease
VTIDADVGEVQCGIPDALWQTGASVRVSQLEASDYLVGAEIGIERKSVLDLNQASGRRFPHRFTTR